MTASDTRTAFAYPTAAQVDRQTPSSQSAAGADASMAHLTQSQNDVGAAIRQRARGDNGRSLAGDAVRVRNSRFLSGRIRHSSASSCSRCFTPARLVDCAARRNSAGAIDGRTATAGGTTAGRRAGRRLSRRPGLGVATVGCGAAIAAAARRSRAAAGRRRVAPSFR